MGWIMSDISTFGQTPEQLQNILRAIGLEKSDAAPPSEQTSSVEASESIPLDQTDTCIGPYKLLRVLGEGGMGIVYLAEQSGGIRRKVALKVIKPGMDSKRVLARFEAERQALGLLDHPGIAHVYDAGTSPNARPYFAMEYVKGLPIDEYCDRHRLCIEDRLRLFSKVCLAVHHAHQKGIIHRDLKPSNIMVSTEGDQAMPKIIDFGVAKAISQPLTEHTLFTVDGHLLGTPEYMSPEQVETMNEDIDTRSDVYCLGVLLYELLTGTLPFDPKELRESGIEHIRKVIRETDPKTPSTRLTKLGGGAKQVAENRRTEIAALAKCLHRELEWIPLKAMRKERSERYRSASELADDIEKYLTGDPLLAGPPSACYRLKKSLYRHKALVSGIAAVLIVSVVGAIVSVIFALGQAKARAQQARALAENEAMTLYLRYFILAPLSQATAPSIRQVFDNTLKTLGSRLAEYPHSEAELRFQIGKLYLYRFSTYDVALSNLERAVELRPVIGYQNYLGLAYNIVGRYADAEVLFKDYVERAGEAIAQGKRGPNDFYSALKCHLAETYHLMGHYDEAERHLREAERIIRQKWYGQELIYKRMLPDLLRDRGRYQEARRLYGDLLERSRSTGASTQGKDLPIIKELGILHMLEGDFDKAALLLEKALEGAKEKWGEEQWNIVDYKIALAVLRTKQGHHEEAESLFDKALSDMEDRLDDDHPELLRAKCHLGVLHTEQKRYNEAEILLIDVTQAQRDNLNLGPNHPATLTSMYELGLLYLAQSQYEKAESHLLEAVRSREAKLRPNHPHTVESLEQLIQLYEAWGKSDEAEKWEVRLSEIQFGVSQ